MASEGALKFVKAPTRTLRYASGRDMPPRVSQATPLDDDATVKQAAWLGHAAHRCSAFTLKYLL